MLTQQLNHALYMKFIIHIHIYKVLVGFYALLLCQVYFAFWILVFLYFSLLFILLFFIHLYNIRFFINICFCYRLVIHTARHCICCELSSCLAPPKSNRIFAWLMRFSHANILWQTAEGCKQVVTAAGCSDCTYLYKYYIRLKVAWRRL